ncbi:MAG TPA: hypothetical protein VHH92_07790 [Actinomycetota bacterium]|nr:hypothetical protein [Actinomycetota bacterium]
MEGGCRGARALGAPLVMVTAVITGCAGKLAARPPSEPVRLRIVFVEGASATYRTELAAVQVADTEAGPAGVRAEAAYDVTHRAVDVASDGAATVLVDLDPVFEAVNGQPVPIDANPAPWRIVVAPEGAILDSARPIALEPVEPDDSGAPIVLTNPAAAINPFPFLATEPVSAGTRWTAGGALPSPFGGGTVPFDVEGRLVRYELAAGVAAAVVECRVSVDIDVTVEAAEYLTGTGQTDVVLPEGAELDYDSGLRYVQRAWLEPASGQVLRSEITGTFVTDAEWTGAPEEEGFEPIHVEGSVRATTERTG